MEFTEGVVRSRSSIFNYPERYARPVIHLTYFQNNLTNNL